MPTPKPTINLVDIRHHASYHDDPDHAFLVDTVKNTIEPRPGAYVSEQQVQDYLGMNWTVNIRRPKDSDFPGLG